MMKNNKFKIAFDLDGVVYDFIEPLDKYMISNGFNLKDKTSYDIGTRYDATKEIGIAEMHKFGELRPFMYIPLIKKGKNEINEMSKHNELYIITHRTWTKYGIKDTLKRIKKDNLPVNANNVIFSGEKGHLAKVLGIELFYEDSAENALDIVNKSKSLVALIDTPYNKIEHNRIIRIKW